MQTESRDWDVGYITAQDTHCFVTCRCGQEFSVGEEVTTCECGLAYYNVFSCYRIERTDDV